ncbi:MAG: FAD-binding protein, partial [Anaerolineae bacterium]
MATDERNDELERLAGALVDALGSDAVRRDEPLARHTSLRIGGPADLLAVAETSGALQRAVALAWEHRVPLLVLGSGANVLVSDAGVRGLVVLNRARAIRFVGLDSDTDDGTPGVRAESGASL